MAQNVMFIKVDNTWKRVSRAWKKSGSSWSLQSDVSTVFDPNKQYVRG